MKKAIFREKIEIFFFTEKILIEPKKPKKTLLVSWEKTSHCGHFLFIPFFVVSSSVILYQFELKLFKYLNLFYLVETR